MKKFIFGVMLLVSLLGIIGCADPSNSDGSDGSENVVYTVKNSTGSEMTISYKNKSDVYVNEKTITADGTYEIPVSDAKISIEVFTFNGASWNVSKIHLKIKVGDTVVEDSIDGSLEKVANIYGIESGEIQVGFN